MPPADSTSEPARGLARFDGPLRPFLLASFQSSLGNEMAYVALLLLAYAQSRSSWAITALLAAEYVTSLLLANAAGALVDRHSRRLLLVSSDLARSAVYVGLAFSPSLGVTLVLAAAASAGQTVFRPASRSAIPSLTDHEGIGTAMSGLSVVGSVASTAGPLLAGAILLIGGPSSVLLVNAATFLISAAVLSRLPLDTPHADHDADPDVADVSEHGLRGTLRLLGSLRAVPAVFIVGVGASLAFAMINVAEPLLVRNSLGGTDASFALLVALFGAGATAGAALARTRMPLMFLAGGGSVLTLGLTAAAPSVVIAGPLFAASGLFAGLFITTEDRLLATLVPQRIQGRVYGFKDSLESAAFLGAYVIAGGVAALSGPRAVFMASAATALVLGIAALRLTHQGDRAPVARHAAPDG